MGNKSELILRSLTLGLFIISYYDASVAGLFGEVVEDATTDRLFEDMGQADVIEFKIEDGIISFNVTLEDRQGQDEFWLIDFQPFVYMGKAAISFTTAYLSSNATGTCSNVEQSHSITDGYFEDDFFQSGNSTGSKELFATYERGFYDDNGTRVDSMSYVGKMDSLMNCKHSDGSLAWQYHIGDQEITFTTVLYATNVRPIKASVQLEESVAYVQTNIRLVWTISRIAILNFVIASQEVYEPKMIEWVGRVIVEFDFAIVEPYILEDGTPDTSRVHLEMGISTHTPVSNTSLLVFMGEEFMYYIADTPGNIMTDIIKTPPTVIEESPSCTFRRQGYCRQQWEFEFILEMNTTFLSEEKPLDATGVFYFHFDSYHCEDLVPSIDCVSHGLPLWNVSADVTLQTVVDIVDEEMDVVSVSVIKMTNDKGEDLRGGSPVSHLENVTVEVAISPSFLRERFQLELSLFMVCMGEDPSKSTRGCLGSDESERYTAFMADDFEMDYDPLLDPMYLIESSTSAHSLTTPTTAVTEPTRFVEVVTTRHFLLVQEPTTGSIHLLPIEQLTPVDYDKVLDDIHIQTVMPPSETSKHEFVIVQSKSSLSLFLSEAAYSEFVRNVNDPQLFHVFQHIYDPMVKVWSDVYQEKLFSAYLKFPGGEISYFGSSDPTLVPCNQFVELSDNQENTRHQLSPFDPDISEDDFSYLMDMGGFYSLMINLTGSEGEDESDNFEGGNFQSVEQWENVRNRFDGVFNGDNGLELLIIDAVRIAHDDGPQRLQELMYALILFQPNISSTLVSDHVVSILGDLKKWTSNSEEELFDFMSSVVANSIFDPVIQGRTTLVDHLKAAVRNLKLLYPEKKDWDQIDAEFSPAYWDQHHFDETFYYLLMNLTLQKDGHWNGDEYIATSHVTQFAYGGIDIDDDEITDRIIGYKVLSCSVMWDYTASLWVYRDPQVEYMETLAGGWDHWSVWSSCSASCESGVQVRQRICLDRQVPCTGKSDELRTCNDLRCGLFKDEGNLVHHVILSVEARTFVQIQQYCASMQAVLVSYPQTPMQDDYILNQMEYHQIDHIWIKAHSLGTCPILRYNGEVVADANCSHLHKSFCMKDFVTVFEGFAGTGQSIVDAWYGRLSDVEGSSSHPQHFADHELIGMWNKAINVQMIQLALYKKDQIVVDLKFDGTGTTKTDWLKADHLETAWPYHDMTGEGSQPILQKHRDRSMHKKVFTAEKKLGNCNKRSGWVMILDDEENIMCDWQKHRQYPLFLYSQRDTASRWNSQFIGSATRVVVSLKYYMQEPSAPPPTLPPSIVYTTQNVEAPEEWQKLNYEEYDEENQLHRSDFTNFALSADTAMYSMTAVYGVVEKPNRRKRGQAHRAQRSLIKSLEFPQMKSVPFAFMGCPMDSLHNPSLLSCDCESPGYVYSRYSFTCEPGQQLEVCQSSTPVSTAFGIKNTSPSMNALVLCIMRIAATELNE